MAHSNPAALPSAVNTGPTGFHLEHLKLDFTNAKDMPFNEGDPSPSISSRSSSSFHSDFEVDEERRRIEEESDTMLWPKVLELRNEIEGFIIVPNKDLLEDEKQNYEDIGKKHKQIYDKIITQNTPIYRKVLTEANETFRKVREATYAFCRDKKNILILDREKFMTLPELSYELALYSYNSFKVAINLTNSLYDLLQHPFVSCKTVVEREEFSIDINGRTMIRIYSLTPGAASKSKDYAIKIVAPYKLYDFEGVSNVPPEIELIILLENLIYAEKSVSLLSSEDDYIGRLIMETIERYKKHIEEVRENKFLIQNHHHHNDHHAKKIQPKKGGKGDRESEGNREGEDEESGNESESDSESDRDRDRESEGDRDRESDNENKFPKDESTDEVYCPKYGGTILKSCKDGAKDFMNQLKIMIIYDWLFEQKDVILFGSWAVLLKRYGREKLCFNNDRIQVLCMQNAEWLKSSLQTFIEENLGKHELILSDQYNMELPDEYRLKRHSIKIVVPGTKGGEERILIETFNMLDYAAVPVAELDGYYLLCKELELKYLLVDLWMFFNIFNTGNVSKEKYLNYIENILKNIIHVMEKYPPVTHVLGYNVPYVEYRKFIMIEGKKHFPYFPYIKKLNI